MSIFAVVPVHSFLLWNIFTCELWYKENVDEWYLDGKQQNKNKHNWAICVVNFGELSNINIHTDTHYTQWHAYIWKITVTKPFMKYLYMGWSWEKMMVRWLLCLFCSFCFDSSINYRSEGWDDGDGDLTVMMHTILFSVFVNLLSFMYSWMYNVLYICILYNVYN